jgi:decaprenylphospho-beta-D-ribofuranose 2-oxidase
MMTCAPANEAAVRAAVAFDAPRGVISYGNGRSYGDQPLNDGGHAVLTSGLNRVLDFDPSSGELTCESGVTLAAIIRQFLPRGFIPTVSPGTGFVTVGGAIANDVHGKNHDRHGSFGNYVKWLDLALPGGELVRISPDQHKRWFEATIGGCGLTGVIVRACVRLMPVPSNAVQLREERAANLDAMMARFEALRDSATYLVAWVDALTSGPSLGRGIVESAELSGQGVEPASSRRLGMPFELPGAVLNPLSIGLFNAVYYRRVPSAGRERRVAIEKFLYPLDAIANWNRMYGRRGFFQFQCVLPDESAATGMRKLLTTIARHRAGSFLAVLKTLGACSAGMLSFPMRGYTLALDFPNRGEVRALLAELEAITLDHGGRIYLAKDAALSAQGFRAMYPRIDEFLEVLDEVDPRRRMRSDMAERLGLQRPGAT